MTRQPVPVKESKMPSRKKCTAVPPALDEIARAMLLVPDLAAQKRIAAARTLIADAIGKHAEAHALLCDAAAIVHRSNEEGVPLEEFSPGCYVNLPGIASVETSLEADLASSLSCAIAVSLNGDGGDANRCISYLANLLGQTSEDVTSEIVRELAQLDADELAEVRVKLAGRSLGVRRG